LVEERRWNRTHVLMMVIIVIMIAAILGLYFWEPEDNVSFTRRGTIGVIEVYGVIDDTDKAYVLSSAVEEALMDAKVKAVVLDIDSPGGSAYLIEQVYLDLLELRKEKPVVASISMALSGGYYIAVSADHIYSLPSAMVGNVGVIGTSPGWIVPSEATLETGPNKITGFSPERFPFDLTTVLETFSNAVVEGRGSSLKIPVSTLTSGSVWLGVDAEGNGLVDQLGSMQSAIRYAAELANLDDYDVESMLARVANSSELIKIYYPTIHELNEKNPPPAIYYLYLPQDIYVQNDQLENTTSPNNVTSVRGDVIVDMSHQNLVSPWILDVFTRLLTEERLFVGYANKWEELESALNETRALVIACPSESYSNEEYETINSWVTKGGLLILLGDASSDFLRVSSLQAPLNSLSNHWGIHFGNGYLYNVEENYGFYRNIVVRDIRDSFLSEGLDELIFYTAGPVYSKSRGYMTASDNTYNSVTERADEYDTVAIYKIGDARVVAFGDMTWLMEPYVNAADNYQLLRNLVEEIASTD
jgi:ClpP class serine protease